MWFLSSSLMLVRDWHKGNALSFYLDCVWFVYLLLLS